MESRLDYTSVSLAVQRFKDRRLRMKTLGRLAAVNGKRRKSRQMSNVEMRARVWFTLGPALAHRQVSLCGIAGIDDCG